MGLRGEILLFVSFVVENMTSVIFFEQERALGQCMWYEEAKEIAYEKGEEADHA